MDQQYSVFVSAGFCSCSEEEIAPLTPVHSAGTVDLLSFFVAIKANY